ncbi:natterin-4 [Anaeramoeba flamelloides]|uniref:Natterin-4 n=1 Tax=Anaeramoeba flamelloides TaxID=1746091 RepID=A0AAV7YD48_9EUKA|nr:natterin-4 [Anaeramoeba flamelloides]
MTIYTGLNYHLKGSRENEEPMHVTVNKEGWCLHSQEHKKYSQWVFYPQGNDEYTIKSTIGNYQETWNLGFRNPTRAVGMYKNGGSRWKFEHIEGDWYYIILCNKKYAGYYLSRSKKNWCYLYSKRSKAAKYHIELVTPWKVTNIDFDISIKPTISKPIASETTVEENNTSLQQSNTFEFEKTISTRKEFVQTSGFSIGASTEFDAKMPIVAGGKVTLSAEVSHETTETDEEAQSTTIRMSRECITPPFSKTTASLVILKSSAKIPYTITYENGNLTRESKGFLQLENITQTKIKLEEESLNK